MNLNKRIALGALLAMALVLAPGTSQARWMNPRTGRFHTMDTYEGDRQQPLSLHNYLYCNDNPVEHADPTGQAILINKTGNNVVVTGNVGAGHGSGAQRFGVIVTGQTGGGASHPIAAYDTRRDALLAVNFASLRARSVGSILDIDWYDDPSRSNHEPLSESGKLIGDDIGPTYELWKDEWGWHDYHYYTVAHKLTVPGAYVRRGVERVGDLLSAYGGGWLGFP
jgi:hypothetical protein